MPFETPFPDPEVIMVVRKKHEEYYRLSRLNAYTYYVTRLIAGLCSALLPFAVGVNDRVATFLAIAVAVTIAFDSVFKPRDRWQLYSRATDLLTIAEAKVTGQYERNKESLDLILATEAMKVDRLVDLKDVLEQVRNAPS